MRTGGILLVSAAMLACTACLGGGGKLEIRSSNSGLKAGNEPVPYRIAEARGQLAIGNVALALEGFRKAEREDPASIEAIAGIAQCYDQMGRYDLSRRYYEQALAQAPHDTALLALLAGSLDRQGLRNDAGNVRREIAALAAAGSAAAAQAESDAIAATVQVAAPVGQSVTIALPPARPADAAPKPAPRQEVAMAPVGRTVTIALPPARPVEAQEVKPGPRLERLSMNEVALFTSDGPHWKRPTPQPLMAARRTQPAQLARRPEPVLFANVRILNAARAEKLAARTRAYLGHFGWKEIAVGDADVIRQRSLIVYPKGSQAAATRLAARLGFATAARNDVRQLTILLGRDAVTHPALRLKA
jgi:tetratricopeptide (TPR) repeat protein